MKTLLKIILLVIFGFCFGLFFSPVVIYGVMNVGNLAGMALFGGLFCLTLFFKKAKAAFTNRVWAKKAGRAAALLLAAVLTVGFLFAGITGGRIVKAAKNAPPAEADLTVVVLGCRVYDSGPSLMLWSRIDTAYDYLIAHPDAKCVLSGGQGEDEPISEADAMFNALTARGVDPGRLYKEAGSTSTEENILNSVALIRENGLPEGIVIVTNEYHEYRAARFAAAAGVEECFSASAPSQKILLPTYFVREIFGVAYLELFSI